MTASTLLVTFGPAPDVECADQPDGPRTIRGLVAPYGQPGGTSAGRFSILPGAIALPDPLSRVKLLYGHNREAPIGYATAAEDTAEGLWMTFQLGGVDLARQAYAEAADGLRDAFSVEIGDMTIRRGQLHAASLRAVALLSVPAYADARAAFAADLGPDPVQDPAAPSPDQAPSVTPEAASSPPAAATPAAQQAPPSGDPATRPDDPDDPDSTPEGENMTTSTEAQAAAPQGVRGAVTTRQAPPQRSLDDFFRALSMRHTGQRLDEEAHAALVDVTHTANEWVQQTQYAGELWSGVQYRRRIVPLVSPGRLTSYKVSGWRWATKPVVAAWAGDKAAVPSNAAVTEAAETEAERLAGAHDIDRKFRDFGDTGFFESYYRAMTESYAMLSDAALAADLEAGATAVAGESDGLIAALVAGVLALPDGMAPSYALAGPDLLADAFGLTVDQLPALLNLSLDLGGEVAGTGSVPGALRVVPHSQFTGQVLVGARGAATFYELSPTPIRVEAVDLVNGGIDAGVFGYYATIINDADGLQLVDAVIGA